MVIYDIMFLILLLIAIHFRFSTMLGNMETAFLYGDFEGKVNMECPHGMKYVGKGDCIILSKVIHGLPQA